ncbi:MAG TPA: hypothetical protein VK897_09580 [Anaerolineales bacterium]|nr:hypothetical protein [Anaerolineales bacterium]
MSNKKGKASKPSQPPQPPSIEPKIRFYPHQLIGIPLMMLIPILALFGVFGQTVSSVDASNPQLQMHVEYPTRFRYKLIDSITVSLFNASNQVIPTVNVHFDRPYIERFSTVTFSPSIKTITENAYIVEVTDLQPHETRAISVTVQAEKYGKHGGTIWAAPEGSEGLRVQVDTITFP